MCLVSHGCVTPVAAPVARLNDRSSERSMSGDRAAERPRVLNEHRALSEPRSHHSPRWLDKKLRLVRQHEPLREPCSPSWPELDRRRLPVSFQALPPQEPERPCHRVVPHHRSRHPVELPQLPEPLPWLDQMEVVLPQSTEEELRKELRTAQPLLLQQRLLDVEQRLPTPLSPHREGQ